MWLEFELIYNNVAVQHISHNTIETPPTTYFFETPWQKIIS